MSDDPYYIQNDEYAITPLAFICSSTKTCKYYFLDHVGRERNDTISHVVCLITRSERKHKYDEGVSITSKVKVLKLRLLLEDEGILDKKFFFNFCVKSEEVFKYHRYDFSCNRALFNEHPSTDEGSIKEIDFYCGVYAVKLKIELDQMYIERSTLKSTRMDSIYTYNDSFYSMNFIVAERFSKHNLFMYFAYSNNSTMSIAPTFLKRDEISGKMINDPFSIPPMPLNSNSYLIHSTILSRLDVSGEEFLMIHFRDNTAKKYQHLIRRIHADPKEELRNAKLSKCDFANFFKHFNEKNRILSHCRLTDTCYLYKLTSCVLESVGQLSCQNINEFDEITKWVLIDLEQFTVREIHPYSLKLLPSSAQPEISSEVTQIDEEGFITTQKRKKYFRISRKQTQLSTKYCDFSHISLSSYKPFPTTNPSLVNVLCTVQVNENRKSDLVKRKQTEHSVVFINYQFNILKELRPYNLLSKVVNKSFADVIIQTN